MRILILAAEYPPEAGGVGAFAAGISHGLTTNGHSVTVITSSPSPGKPGAGGQRIIRLPSLFHRRYIKLAGALPVAIWTAIWTRPHAVVAMTWTHDGVTALALKLIACRRYGLFMHGSDITERPGGVLRGMARRAVVRNAHAVFANSIFTADLVREHGLPSRSIEVINPPLGPIVSAGPETVARIRRDLGLEGRRVLLTVSRLVARKGHATVIRALPLIRRDFPDVTYVATGEGPLKNELAALAQSLGVAGSVHFTGRLSDADVDALYRLADVYVSPSDVVGGDVEGFGIAFIEAAARGLPSVAGKSGGVAEAVLDGVTGFLAQPGDPADTASKVGRLLADRALRRTMGAAAREHASRFTPESQAAKLERALNIT